MNRTSFVLGIVVCAAASSAQASQPKSTQRMVHQNDAGIVGVWRANADSLPFVILNITNESGSLSGAVLFFLHRRDPSKPVTSTPGLPLPLLNPSFDGRVLAFDVSHHQAHPPATLSDPPVHFILKLAGPNKAWLFKGEDDSPTGLEMTRSDY